MRRYSIAAVAASTRRAILVGDVEGAFAAVTCAGLFLLLVPMPLLFSPDPTNDTARVFAAIRVRFETAEPPHRSFVGIWACASLTLPLLPLRLLSRPARALSLLLWWVGIASLVDPTQRQHTWVMLRTEPAMGYMAQDTLNIAIVSAVCVPNRAHIFTGGPSYAMFSCPPLCPSWNISRALAFSIAATLLVLPSVAPMIDDDDKLLKFRGYETPSIFGSMWSIQLVLCWLAALHLISRTFMHALRRGLLSGTLALVFASTLWLLAGNLLVMTYVCIAWPLHFAVATLLQVPRLT